ncbi:hypothetical protein SGFS_055540 [Streptomyces graminofaciens]|uniref:SecDF P1 head subdomain domain-containing protein n=2 Tax=Streptomyces graminofaciens TaxID=68212 RepID=A0ABN5VLW0_9ACTN|nr:hypothetical protein SGFS_055540 [Streptomyces graminofaciens]
MCLVALVGGCGGSSDSAGSGGSPGVHGSAAARSPQVVVTFAPESGAPSTPAALKRTAELIRDRAEAAGLGETEVTVEGGQITVTGPVARQKSLESLGEPAELGFRPVLSQAAAAGGEDECRAAADASPSEPITACGEYQGTRYTYELEPVAVPGTDVADAEAAFDKNSGTGWFVKLEFTSAGAQKFTDVTGRLATQTSPNNQFAIVLDGTVLSAPQVNTAITGGKAEISGTFTKREAQELAAHLSTGALPVRLTTASVSRILPN